MPSRPRARHPLALAALLALVLLAAAAIGWYAFAPPPRHARSPAVPAAGTTGDARTFESAHYTVSTRASDEQTRRAAAAAESLRTAYLATFPDAAAKATPGRHRLVLYRRPPAFE